MGKSKKKIRICAYCGICKASEREHVFTKSMFSEENRENLITVPTCPECNDTFQRDEEYFRLMMSVAYPSFAGSKSAKTLWPTIQRMLKRPKSRPFVQQSFQKWKYADIHRGGIYLGTNPSIQWDWPRIEHIIIKFTRGLYFHHFNECLGNNVSFRIRCLNPELPDTALKEFMSLPSIQSAISNSKRFNIGNGTARYSFTITNDNNRFGFWSFNFYENYLTFYSFVEPFQLAQPVRPPE